ncbi:MAG: hypothetical protein QM572_18075 [Nocardioides sp.]|uniref:divisome protein SepX/GlpR n=1 Tax=Nocardioides sp. TaxID=35761 RepID=UPI0039E53583
MDPSALIFVALALAWAAYLIPKALEHHDAGARSRSISTFSERIRVLARREAISRRSSALVRPKTAAPAPAAVVEAAAEAPGEAAPVAIPVATAVEVEDSRPVEVIVQEILVDSLLETTTSGRLHLPSDRPQVRRTAAAVAARRRRRVLWVLVFALAAVAATAAGQVISWLWVLAPAAVVVAWLVACRLMVRNAGSRRDPASRPARPGLVRREIRVDAAEESVVDTSTTIAALADDDTSSLPALTAEGEPVAEGMWEPVEAPLPTYVSKPSAPRRTITTIDLESTGVWTSGRTEADAALAREADAARASAETAPERRASGA